MKLVSVIICATLLVGCKKQSGTSEFSLIQTDFDSDIEKVVFVNDSTGYMCGGKRRDHGLLAKSLDNGKTWQKIDLFYQNSRKVYDLAFVNTTTAYAASERNLYYRTTDSGSNWPVDWLEASELAYHEVNRATIRRFDVVDNNHLFFVGGENYQVGVFYKSIDGGANWTFDTLKHELRAVDFISPNVGFIGGYGYLARTINGGESWEKIELLNNFIVAIKLFSESEILCISQNGGIFRSTDKGDTWQTVRKANGVFGKRYFFNDMAFVNETDGYICGNNGLILRTLDKGKNWNVIESPVDAELKRISVYADRVYIGTSNGQYLKR